MNSFKNICVIQTRKHTGDLMDNLIEDPETDFKVKSRVRKSVN